MYYEYFGLNQPPFRITPDTSLFFPGGNRGAVLEAMMYAILSGEGIVKVVGEVGSGKTMLCRMLAVELPENVEVVYLANPSLSPDNILHAIAFELKLDVEPNDDRLMVMNKLQNYLLDRHADNRQVVVFVEEAQSMPIATLEEIRLLSNLETKQNKLLQIVLFGQPELDHMISRKEIRQLKERITYSFELNPLKHEEIRDYLNTRLRACGYRSNDPFSKKAVKAISRYSKGLLRRINILADKAMLAAYAGNVHAVSAKHVQAAAKDSEFVFGWQRYGRAIALACVVALLLLAALLLPYQRLLQGNIQPVLNVQPPATATPDESRNIPAAPPPQEEITTIYQPQDSSRYFDYLSKGREETLVVTPAPLTPVDPESNEVAQNQYVSESENTIAKQPLEGELTGGETPVESPITQLLNSANPGLSTQSLMELTNQIMELPPETSLLPGENSCESCTSFIYRPLKKTENL